MNWRRRAFLSELRGGERTTSTRMEGEGEGCVEMAECDLEKTGEHPEYPGNWLREPGPTVTTLSGSSSL